MMGLPDNEDQVCFLVTKHHTWKGRYKRVFSFGTCGVTTYNPDNLEVTNRWPYCDIASIRRTPDRSGKFTISVRKDKNKKIESMSFSTEHRAELLTVASRYSHAFMDPASDFQRFEAQKQHWSGILLPTLLDVSNTSLNQVDVATRDILALYSYKDIDAVYDLSDVPGGFIVAMKNTGRMHLFVTPKKDEIKRKLEENAQLYLAVDIKTQNKPVTLEYFQNNRLGVYSSDEHTTSMVEFSVLKENTMRHQDPPPRLFCISQSCIIERDPESYHIVTCRPLSSVMSLVRDEQDPQEFKIEYIDGGARTYHGSNRDSILATIVDSVRGQGNNDVHVKMNSSNRGKRFGPYHCPLEEEVEAWHLKLLRDSIGKKNMSEAVERFNCNVPYSGLLHSVTQDGLFKDNKERPILEVLQAIVRCKDSLDFDTFCDEEIEALYQCIRRLVASKAGFQAFTQLQGLRECLGYLVVRGLNKDREALTHAAIDMLCALMHPMHEDYDLKQEQHNKSSLLGNEKFLNNLLDKWSSYALSGTGALVVCAVLDFLTFALCHPYSETTEGRNFDALLELMAKRGRSLFKHFQHPCLTIVKGASLIMRAIIEEGETEVAAHMQELALSESALIRHFLIALFTLKIDKPKLGQCRISRHLISLWLVNNENGSLLMQKLLPGGLLAFLESTEKAPADDMETNVRDNLKLAQDHASKNQRNAQVIALEKQLKILEKHLETTLVHWGARIGIEKRQDKFKLAPVTLRKSRQRVKSSQNWALFYHKFNQDHFLPNLIWNHKTRDELKTALMKEIKSFDANREIASNSVIAWNYEEFEVNYPSLKDQLCIDGYYIKILLDGKEAPESLVKTSATFFNNLYHRFLLPTTSEMKCMCLQALALVYYKYHEVIGYFADTKYIVSMLERTTDRSERDRLLMFLHALTFNKDNVKDIVANSNGIEVLVDLTTLAHLHTSRATLPTQSNVIEFGNHTDREQEKEWHYCTSSEANKTDKKISYAELKKLFGEGRIQKDTKVWAQGMHAWKPLLSVTQLKWSLVARGSAVLNESDLATLILNILINMISYYPARNKEGAIIWPMSRIKQVLSNDNCLHHIVQLLLTFDPVIVEKVATLLYKIVEDNVFMSKLYTTGVFYFILMYNGSNVLPIARFLKLTHSKQAFHADESYGSELMQRSILGQLIPEAMIYYLENHGPEKFAQIYLGEYDTPEAIWNNEMRSMLIQKIAAHIADFTPRLWSNNRAQYEYIVIPVVMYPQLTNELFCNIFYLRHLCDTSKFPNWPINDPVAVLRDVLEAWAAEIKKKPPTMSVEEAYALLDLPKGQNQHDENSIRKAYYKLAQKYHPDKNSEGRLKFEAVNKAYDFLCSRSPWMDNGINTNNVVLILKTQSILFQRYSAVLQPYKYAGYKQLIKTIQLETADERLFSKQTSLLSAAVELIFHTIQCSNLNAEEFNRENGFQASAEAFSRCVSVLSNSTKENEFVSTVCLNCVRIFSISAAFENCLATFKTINSLVPDLLRILHFKSLVKLTCAVVECVTAFSVDPDLQVRLLKAGILWKILSYLFLYDYTLEESGIESSKDANQQEIWNEIAKSSIKACASIAGYSNKNPNNEYNDKVKRVLETLLTPYMAQLISEDQPEQILKTLTSNCETPYLLWDNTTRTELIEFLESCMSNKDDHSLDNIDFKFSNHSSELVVGGIFIRIYNDQPTFKVQDPKKFAVDILDYLKTNRPTRSTREPQLTNIVMVLTSLYNLVQNNQGAALQCIGHFPLLFSYVTLEPHESIQVKSLSAISLLSKNEECVNDIAAAIVISHLLLVLYSLQAHRLLTLDCLHSLVTSSAIVKELISKGCLTYLVDIIMNSKVNEVKVRAAELLGRLMEDKVSGPRVRLLLLQLLPSAICDGFLESPQSTINILQTNQENPEVIWTEDDRDHISTVISTHCQKQHLSQKNDPDITCQMPDVKITRRINPNEVIVGDVYLRLYNQNPAWTLRKPVKFLSDLLDAFLKQMAKPHDKTVEAIGKALANVLSFNPGLANDIPSIGLLPRLFAAWKVPNEQVSRQAFLILNPIFENESCVDSLNRSRTETMLPFKNAMVAHPELVSVACDCLSKLSEFKADHLVKQAVECDLINYLLKLLGQHLPSCENQARTKALIVRTLKNMASSPFAGPTVAGILERSTIWPSYSEQNHDLFITASATNAYLTAGPATAGYLTQGSKPMPSAPPPVEKQEM